MKTKIRISFQSKNQLPYLMIVKEYYKNSGGIEHAEVIYQEQYVDSDIEIDPETIMRLKEDGTVKLYGDILVNDIL